MSKYDGDINVDLNYDANGDLFFDGKRLSDLVDEEPVYAYSLKTLTKRVEYYKKSCESFLTPKVDIHYAMKANAHAEILQLMRQSGLGVDVVSGGELSLALSLGFTGSQIIFSGTGKTRHEIRLAIEHKLSQINVESPSELLRICEIAKQESNKNNSWKVPVVLRVNPGIEVPTHPYISTGFKENKFGLDEQLLPQCLEIIKNNSQFVELKGLSQHIGSQILDFSGFQEALRVLRNMFENLQSQGWPVTVMDIGGGVGIDYHKSQNSDVATIEKYMRAVAAETQGFSGRLQMEPGRILVARAGVLLTQIQYIKKTPHKNFIICNSGMNHLLRPALYQAYHRILPVFKRVGPEFAADVVGPVCESSDFLGKDRHFTGLLEDDWLCVLDAGAYGASMMSGYNIFAKAIEKTF